MPFRFLSVCAALLSVGAAAALAQTAAQPDDVPLIQPGAPGQPDKVLTNTVGTGPQGPTEADVSFMQGMIMHHSQAVEMVALMAGRTKNPRLLEFGKRISISQSDEIKFMQRWLTNRNKPLEMGGMAGMDHSHMNMPQMAMPLMPGMLSPQQMDDLRKARGTQFDELFLTGMIQHHTGALTMVDDLFDTPAAAQDAQLFDFTADIGVTQQGEIDAMRNMLTQMKKEKK